MALGAVAFIEHPFRQELGPSLFTQHNAAHDTTVTLATLCFDFPTVQRMPGNSSVSRTARGESLFSARWRAQGVRLGSTCTNF